MMIDGHEVAVSLNGHNSAMVYLDIEEMDPEGTNWIVLAMTPAQVRWLVGALTNAHDVVEGV